MVNLSGIRNALVVTETSVIKEGMVLYDEGTIVYVGPTSQVPKTFDHLVEEAEDIQGDWLLPGFIDLHVHGGLGQDFMNASFEAFDTITAFHAKHGTTSMLATTMTASREAIDRTLETINSYKRNETVFAELLGVHLEGPFLSAKWSGAQNPAYIVPPNTEWLKGWKDRFPELIRMVTLAPEIPGAFDTLNWLIHHKIIASCGHTDATYEEMKVAIHQGISHAVHTFNAMRGMHHREPGTVGAILTDPRISAEIIADGLHVHQVCIELLVQMKTQNNLILVTDAISAAGLGDGDYSLGGLEVVVKNKIAKLKNSDILAGSTLTMFDAFRYMVNEIGLSVPEASLLGSGNPARKLDIYEQVGSISVGKKADLLRISNGSHLELHQVWKKGAKLLVT